MNVRGIAWLGIQSEQFDEMSRFMRGPDGNVYAVLHDPARAKLREGHRTTR